MGSYTQSHPNHPPLPISLVEETERKDKNNYVAKIKSFTKDGIRFGRKNKFIME